jgi:hypothetical protein
VPTANPVEYEKAPCFTSPSIVMNWANTPMQLLKLTTFFTFIRIFLVGAFLMGCASTGKGWVLKVDNSGAGNIQDVQVTLQDGRGHSCSEIKGYGESSAMALGSKPPLGKIELNWKTDSGSTMSQSVTVTNWTSISSGRIVLEVKDVRPLRIFILNDDGQYLGEIPWGNSADWDGTVAFPVNQE